MNHVSSSPLLVLRHKMSVVPSPLKSPVPLITQAAGTPAATDTSSATDVPFRSQIRTLPVEAARNRRSDCRSPLKSFFTIAPLVTVPKLFELEPSLSTQLSVRVGFAPEFVGLVPDVNVPDSST